ncbi:glutaredoxin family protein [Nocardioides mangrovi]|uniref:Glutaredoxin n=1 Tax=Nocardioides mangrovi TaxID=2874580 RepID=A0ABS7UDA3_9ACTN|nr:glutaredoxin [Nocardioides mangrovi]MBZ5738824.1 glutaredoxin [Nocardioides mangrovi]
MTTEVVILVIAALVVVVTLTPYPFPRSPGDEEARADGRPIIYWRTGCSYCLRLRLALGPLGRRAVWVNIRTDPDAAARVRSVNGGDETVPTVFVGEEHRTNPPPSWVREILNR